MCAPWGLLRTRERAGGKESSKTPTGSYIDVVHVSDRPILAVRRRRCSGAVRHALLSIRPLISRCSGAVRPAHRSTRAKDRSYRPAPGSLRCTLTHAVMHWSGKASCTGCKGPESLTPPTLSEMCACWLLSVCSLACVALYIGGRRAPRSGLHGMACPRKRPPG